MQQHTTKTDSKQIEELSKYLDNSNTSLAKSLLFKTSEAESNNGNYESLKLIESKTFKSQIKCSDMVNDQDNNMHRLNIEPFSNSKLIDLFDNVSSNNYLCKFAFFK